MTEKSQISNTGILSKLKDYKELTKFTLSFTVVFTCVISYLLAPNIVSYNWKMITLLFVAGMFITGSANAINQSYEKFTDAVMKRTANRPVASGRMSQQEAYTFAFITGLIGVLMMWYFFNLSSALLSAFSLFLYAFIYTPLKTKNSIAVLIGGFPGALPCLIGWVAGKDDFSIGGWILFAIQFIWQFPHFWAIAWVAHSDYTRAGFKLLPSDKGPTKYTAIQTIMYSVLMIPIGFLPYFYNITGVTSVWILTACNIAMVIQSLRLYKEMNAKAAKRVMFSSYIYLPIVYLAMLADKIKPF
ncbi:MAG: heme o synthase [Chitinophagales bacterium]|nr:heme o synthase [Chitinophagales bacterium]